MRCEALDVVLSDWGRIGSRKKSREGDIRNMISDALLEPGPYF